MNEKSENLEQGPLPLNLGAIEADARERDKRLATKLIGLLREMPIKATFGNVSDVAREVAEIELWLLGLTGLQVPTSTAESVVQCPGCKMILYGDAAARGFCVDCEPA